MGMAAIWLFLVSLALCLINSSDARAQAVALGGGLVNLGGGTFDGVERIDSPGATNGGGSNVLPPGGSSGSGGGGGGGRPVSGGGDCRNWCLTSQKQLYCCSQNNSQRNQ